jgi:hypothetical protein
MNPTKKAFLQTVGLVLFVSAVILVVYLRSDGPAVFAGLGSATLVGIPMSGLICGATALASPRVRSSIARHPILYFAWAIAGAVVLCLLVSSLVATSTARSGHGN